MQFKKFYYLFALGFYLLAASIYIFLDYHKARSNIFHQIDVALSQGAMSIPLILPEGFHHQKMSQQSVSQSKDHENIERLSAQGKLLGIKYLYTCIKIGDKIIFTSSSATDEELTTEKNMTRYFDHYDDASDLLANVFTTHKRAYDEYSDKWGHFRSVYIPLKSADGLDYVACADLEIDFIAAKLNQVLIDSLFEIFFFVLILVPFFFLYRKNMQQINHELELIIDERTHKLAERETTLQLLLDSVVEGIYGVDMNGNCTFVNHSFLRILGYDNDSEILGKHIHKLIHHSHADGSPYPSTECRMYKAYQILELSHADDEVFWCKDGTSVPVEYWSYPMLQNGQFVGAVATFIDIGERKEAENLIIAAKEAAEASARAKSDFLAAMSHEIRTPMNGVLGMLGLLEHSGLNSAQQHQVRVAQSSATSLLGLINDILDFSKIEAGKMDLEMIEFNLCEELGNFAESIAFRAQEKEVELVLDTIKITHPNIISDPGRLRQIVTNLVGNAIKFTNHGQILITASVVAIDDNHGTLHIDITDSGIGIPADKIDSLFDAFTQADGSTTRKYGGTGLGLSIVKRLCQLMGGNVNATSILGAGSTFSVQLPVSLGNDLGLTIPSLSVEGKSVLIVDDNETNRIVLRSQLSVWGMQIDEASSGDEAVHMCRSKIAKGDIPPYDVALIDMQMPKMDGSELGTILRSMQECDTMKMVMMTSLGSRHDAKTFAKIGYNAFFAKPTTAKDLLNSLKILFDDGEVLSHATPLVTKDYLGTLRTQAAQINWPDTTRILLVEDNPTNQIVALGMLETMGLSAEIATNGQEAIDLLNSADTTLPYTLILMDCQMPVMDGFSASRAIRKGEGSAAYQSIPIIAMTANAMSGDRERCLIAGMDDYIAKPINLSILETTLKKWLLDIEENPVSAPSLSTEMNNLPLWDEADARTRVGGNDALLKKILHSFINDGENTLSAFVTAITDKNFFQAQLHAHSIKGSAGNAGAKSLQALSAKAEAAAERQDILFLQEAYPLLLTEWKRTVDVLKPVLSESNKPVKSHKRFDPLQIALKLQDLKQKLSLQENINTDKENLFGSYQDAVFTAQLAALQEQIDHHFFDDAITAIDKLMSNLE